MARLPAPVPQPPVRGWREGGGLAQGGGAVLESGGGAWLHAGHPARGGRVQRRDGRGQQRPAAHAAAGRHGQEAGRHPAHPRVVRVVHLTVHPAPTEGARLGERRRPDPGELALGRGGHGPRHGAGGLGGVGVAQPPSLVHAPQLARRLVVEAAGAPDARGEFRRLRGVVRGLQRGVADLLLCWQAGGQRGVRVGGGLQLHAAVRARRLLRLQPLQQVVWGEGDKLVRYRR